MNTRGGMARRLRADFYVLWHSKFILLPLAVPALIIMDSLIDLEQTLRYGAESVFYYYHQSIMFGGLFGPYLIPMLCALPYAASFAEERGSGMWRPALARGGRRGYFVSKVLTSTLSGGYVYAMGIVLLASLLSIKIPLIGSEDLFFLEGFYYGELALGRPMAYFAVATAYAFMSGAIYGAFAMAASSYTTSKSAVIASPFVLAFASVRVSVIMGIDPQFRPGMWLSMRSLVPSTSEGGTFAVCLAFTVIVVSACGYLLWRRGRQVTFDE